MLVAGADHAVDLGVAAYRVNILPPADALDQLFANFAAACTARQRVFDTVDFRRLRQDEGAAMARQ